MVSKHTENKFSNYKHYSLHVCKQSFKHICIQTYLQATKKRDVKKERKIIFKHTYLQTFKQILYKRDRSAVKSIMPEQDSGKLLIMYSNI